MESEAYYRTRIEQVEGQLKNLKGCRPGPIKARQIHDRLQVLISNLIQVEKQIDAEIQLIRTCYQRAERRPRLKELTMLGFGFTRRLRPDRIPFLLQEMDDKLAHYNMLKTRIQKRAEQIRYVDANLTTFLLKYEKNLIPFP